MNYAMPKFKFFPEDWEPDQKIIDWAKDKGVSEKQVMEQLEEIRDHEFNPMRSCPVRTFRRWIRNAIKWGHLVPSVTREYRKPQELTERQRAADLAKWEEDMKKLRVVK